MGISIAAHLKVEANREREEGCSKYEVRISQSPFLTLLRHFSSRRRCHQPNIFLSDTVSGPFGSLAKVFAWNEGEPCDLFTTGYHSCRRIGSMKKQMCNVVDFGLAKRNH
ncbi:hypothetical protein FRC03_012196 [Tulasnella sp. 419]|nr:hypothetical protein FRC03_012196 [Tulasnella sp. 419]